MDHLITDLAPPPLCTGRSQPQKISVTRPGFDKRIWWATYAPTLRRACTCYPCRGICPTSNGLQWRWRRKYLWRSYPPCGRRRIICWYCIKWHWPYCHFTSTNYITSFILLVGKPSKNLNSVSFSRYFSFITMYFNGNLDSTIKKENFHRTRKCYNMYGVVKYI